MQRITLDNVRPLVMCYQPKSAPEQTMEKSFYLQLDCILSEIFHFSSLVNCVFRFTDQLHDSCTPGEITAFQDETSDRISAFRKVTRMPGDALERFGHIPHVSDASVPDTDHPPLFPLLPSHVASVDPLPSVETPSASA